MELLIQLFTFIYSSVYLRHESNWVSHGKIIIGIIKPVFCVGVCKYLYANDVIVNVVENEMK